MFTVEHRVGRLVEVRVRALGDLEHLARYEQELRALCALLPGRLVGVADLRDVEVFPPDVAEGLIGLLTRVNAKFERSAILPPNDRATFSLQMERLVRSSGSPSRRTFRSTADVERWLGEVLDPDERTRLAGFLARAPR